MTIINLVGQTTLMYPNISSSSNVINIFGTIEETLADDKYTEIDVKFNTYEFDEEDSVKKINNLPIQFHIRETKEGGEYFNSLHFTLAPFKAYYSQVDCLLFLDNIQIGNLLVMFSNNPKRSFNISLLSDRVFGEDGFINVEDRFSDNEKPLLDGSKNDLSEHFEIRNYEFFQNYWQDNT